MRVLFLSVYNTPCLGARLLLSNIIAHGHEGRLILFKDCVGKDFYYNKPEDMEEYPRIMHSKTMYPVSEFMADHDYVSPYPTKITEEEKEMLFQEIRDYDPEIIAVSLGTAFVHLNRELSKEMKARFPKKLIVWGGVPCILGPEDGIGAADVICNSEADEIFPEFLKDPYRKDQLGFWFCSDKGVDRNPCAPLPQDLDQFPYPSYGNHDVEVFIEGNQKRRWTPMVVQYILISQRGCPYKCTYCYHSGVKEAFRGKGKYLRRRSPENVLGEIEMMIEKFKYSLISFWDDLFMIDKKWIGEFCRGYKARFPKIPFGAYAHLDFTDREMLETMKDAGCYFASIGIQSGSPYINEKVYHRHETPDQVVAFAEMIQSVGLKAMFYDIISNSEYEREEDCRATLDLLCRLPVPTKTSVKKLQCFPHTAYANLDLPKGGLSEETFEFFNHLYLLTGTPNISKDWIRRLSVDPYWRENMGYLRELSATLLKENQQRLTSEETIVGLRGQVAIEQSKIPTGVRSSAKHLWGELGKSFKRRILGQE